MIILLNVLLLLAAYVIGSFPSAYIIARLRKGIDIRSVGSHNMGAMNTFYKVGFWYGIAVLALDIGKGAGALVLVDHFSDNYITLLLSGVAVIVGHIFPLFLKFKGGTGGAPCIGVLIYLMPWGAPIYLAVFILLLLITRFPTLSYSVSFFCFPFVAWLINHDNNLVIFSIGILLVPGIKYIPRVLEIRSKSGGWKHFFLRRNLKDRL